MFERGGKGGRQPGRGPTRGPAGRPGAFSRGQGNPPEGRPSEPPAAIRPRGIRLRPLRDNLFVLDHPPCVEAMRPDYEEGLEAWQAGALDEARDAFRFALEGCGDNIWVHVALGRLALEAHNDVNLARGHFGYAYELVRRILPNHFNGILPRDRDANRPLYDALDGLATCAERQDAHDELRDLVALRHRLQGNT